MNFKQNLIVAALAIFAVSVTANENDFYYQDSNMGLLNFMSRSNNLLQRNPTRSVECFNYYIPLINELAEEYEINYKACLTNSAAAREDAEEATASQRTDLANRAEASCALLSKCIISESVEKEFECYAKGGSENSKTMYGINADASDELANLVEEYRLIKNKENRCTNDTKRAYEKESNQAYIDFNNCIMGISEVPTVAPTTDGPTDAPTDSPTDAPTDAQTDGPTDGPTESPTNAPTDAQTDGPTDGSTDTPTDSPTDAPTDGPTDAPTDSPTDTPTDAPTDGPTDGPTDSPTDSPTNAPTDASTDDPTNGPTDAPTDAPTDGPTNSPTNAPTDSASTEEYNSTEEHNSTEETSTEESSAETEETRLPEEDLSRLLAQKNLKYRLKHYKV